MFRLWIVSASLSLVAATTTVVGNTRFVLIDDGQTTYGNESVCSSQNMRVRKEW
jgi:hypothetical protein